MSWSRSFSGSALPKVEDASFAILWRLLSVPSIISIVEALVMERRVLVVADNVVYPGAPGYLDRVAAPAYETTLTPVAYESVGWETNWKKVEDAMSVSRRVL